MNVLSEAWFAVARLSDIRHKPKRIMFFGKPVVLFRSGAKIAALYDRCPHRLVELSGGKVCNGEIECPYHGWRFNASGYCTSIPGLIEKTPVLRIPTLQTFEKEGVLFLSKGRPEHLPYLHCMEGRKTRIKLVRSQTRTSVLDAAENILDATHTHFTHKGLLRGLSPKRQRVRVTLTGGDGWVEACYAGEERQHGLISRLLEGPRLKTIGRFRYPGVAELEYWSVKGLVLVTTFHLRQSTNEHVEGIGCLIGPRGGILDYLKSFAFGPMFSIALQQDRKVLKSSSKNAAFFPNVRPVIGPLDFLRRDIEAIMAGKLPEAANTPSTCFIDL